MHCLVPVLKEAPANFCCPGCTHEDEAAQRKRRREGPWLKFGRTQTVADFHGALGRDVALITADLPDDPQAPKEVAKKGKNAKKARK
jgi:hypothetical protein